MAESDDELVDMIADLRSAIDSLRQELEHFKNEMSAQLQRIMDRLDGSA